MNTQIPALIFLSLCLSCTPSAPKHLGLPSTFRTGFERFGNGPVLVPGTNQTVSLVTVSAKLGCDLPCTKRSVDSVGKCISGIAVRCEAGRIVCDECWSAAKECVQVDDGAAQCVRECEGVEICPAPSECFLQQCCPNSRWCEDGAQVICDGTGQSSISQTCVKGLDCYGGQCRPSRPYVHILFDTSGSMTWKSNGEPASPTIHPEVNQYPACDNPASPILRLGKSKKAFFELFGDPQFDHVLFALQRFPQNLAPDLKAKCQAGPFQAQSFITGHANVKYAINDGPDGDWFLNNLAEILLVGFPVKSAVTNRDALKAWLDFQETQTESEIGCFNHSDCVQGLCSAPKSGGRCIEFENPELRAEGWTPLGLSIFYAGEYLRKEVVVDGMTCLLDADCGSAAYFCKNGRCHDPNRFCRQRSLVLFTDGQDTASPGSWFQPIVQAKRLRIGLDCNGDGDCGSGSRCAFNNTCQLVDHPLNPCAAVNFACNANEMTFPDAFKSKNTRLRDRNGDPIEITVHVVDATNSVTLESASMAAYGGGLLVPVDFAESVSLLKAIQGVVNWKDANFCP